ncbi:monocyte chemotactic protein 1B-like [Brachyhypopomus gauderio]|uniref:monocyte chemotactic protein 1B-like n=1 Tax=Brachyhypopomus gauderio TaxID=698409 RepID=UPI0040420153
MSVYEIIHSARMRKLSALLFVLLLWSLQLVSSVPSGYIADCCSKLTDVMIPLKKVVSYRYTHSNCPIKAIVFETVSGKQFCVSPDAVWVSSRVTAVDTRNNTTMKTTTTTPTVHSE